ncbi:MAG: hypothetical protein ACOCQD_00030 [archaeon]
MSINLDEIRIDDDYETSQALMEKFETYKKPMDFEVLFDVSEISYRDSEEIENILISGDYEERIELLENIIKISNRINNLCISNEKLNDKLGKKDYQEDFDLLYNIYKERIDDLVVIHDLDEVVFDSLRNLENDELLRMFPEITCDILLENYINKLETFYQEHGVDELESSGISEPLFEVINESPVPTGIIENPEDIEYKYRDIIVDMLVNEIKNIPDTKKTLAYKLLNVYEEKFEDYGTIFDNIINEYNIELKSSVDELPESLQYLVNRYLIGQYISISSLNKDMENLKQNIEKNCR